MKQESPVNVDDIIVHNDSRTFFKVVTVSDKSVTACNHLGATTTLLRSNIRVATDNDRVRIPQEHSDACPFCLTGHVQGAFIEVAANTARQENWCDECAASWVSTYVLSAIAQAE